ncbi:xanthine dehydrogenase small subunit [Spelaeicoccus albus]|uniref:Xanthine dehydrogenase small subunit n=1 Tax=Spelaeicoccus albus TaxID=1280376 RepID=A0A7Z0ABX8_9MICO|nr:FAD binding domain-containing protein [Spelaeicoccus albus]NYI67368.1 xanthine dehydrogenase small subunit [Spelaeicoccus albus]
MERPSLTVNGRLRRVDPAGVHTTALQWLRSDGLTGVKEGCAEGECGACAVMVATPDGDGGTAWTSMNACLIPIAALDGQEIVTAEGVGTSERLHPVQEEMAERGGSQCGYCTPGFVCSMAAEFYRPDRQSDAMGRPCNEHGPNGFDLESLSGNLCRCTGYRPIRDAAYALGAPDAGDVLARRMNDPAPGPVGTDLKKSDGRFVRPAGLENALTLLADNPGALPVAGCTDWGVDVNIRGRRESLVVAIDRLPELCAIDESDTHVDIGAAVPLTQIEQWAHGRVRLLSQLVPQFASRLIRNRATLGGNLGTGSPIGDTPPALLALGASVVLASRDGERVVPLGDYFTGYRQTVRADGELIRAVRIPLPCAPMTAFHKVAKRRFDDISSVAIGFALDIDDGQITAARIGLGGVAATPIRAVHTEQELVGRPWNSDTARDAAAALGREGTPMSDHRASSEYRSIMLSQAMLKFFAESGSAPTTIGVTP